MTLGAYILARNEKDLINGCIDLILPYCDEVLLVDHGSTDGTNKILQSYVSYKVKFISIPYLEPVDMGKVRTECYRNMKSDWILAVDADEYYPKEAMETIRTFIENPGNAISARVKYKNLAWREGYAQKDFGHYPDRLYLRKAVDEVRGVLPLDMTFVKKEYLLAPNKQKGDIGVLEYDNEDDRSFIHPKQPILDATYYHLARSRGYNFEFAKNIKYQGFIHPDWSPERIREEVRVNAWVNGIYEMEPVDVPSYIPKRNIINPKVSVVVTCYNKAQYIAECIESVLNQTQKPYEVIVVNDGSTDASLGVIAQYPVILINQENQGVVRARNNGLDKATGDYFIFIDGDDKLKPNYIERCLQEMKGDIQIVTTDFEGLGEWNGRIHQYPHPFDREQLKQAQVFPSVIALCDMRLRSPYGNFQNFIFEDYAWWLELVFRRNANVVHIPEALCYYRRTIGTRCDQANNEEAKDQLRREFSDFNVNPL